MKSFCSRKGLFFLLLILTISPVVLVRTSRAQNDISQSQTRSEEDKRTYRSAMEQADQKIAEEVKARSELVKNLEYLTTQIGARLTGSPQMNRASEWTLQRFKDYGVDAHLETTEIPHAWARGQDTAEITAPFKRSLEIRSAGWSKATEGAVNGSVIFLNLDNSSELEKQKPKL